MYIVSNLLGCFLYHCHDMPVYKVYSDGSEGLIEDSEEFKDPYVQFGVEITDIHRIPAQYLTENASS